MGRVVEAATQREAPDGFMGLVHQRLLGACQALLAQFDGHGGVVAGERRLQRPQRAAEPVRDDVGRQDGVLELALDGAQRLLEQRALPRATEAPGEERALDEVQRGFDARHQRRVVEGRLAFPQGL